MTRLLLIFILSIQSLWASDSFPEWNQERVTQIVEQTADETYKQIQALKVWKYPQTNATEPDKIFNTSSTHWEAGYQWAVVEDHPNGAQMAFIKKEGFLLSCALEDLVKSSTTLECMLAANFVSLKCLEKLLGSKTLDMLCEQWEKKYERRFYFASIGYNPLVLLFFDVKQVSILRWSGRGGFVYFYNDPAYKKMANTTDNAIGQNLVQVGITSEGKPCFSGFSMSAFPVDKIILELRNAFEETASKRKSTLVWDEKALIKENEQPYVYVRTFSNALINAYRQVPNIKKAEEGNKTVLAKFPLPKIVSFKEFLMFMN